MSVFPRLKINSSSSSSSSSSSFSIVDVRHGLNVFTIYMVSVFRKVSSFCSGVIRSACFSLLYFCTLSPSYAVTLGELIKWPEKMGGRW